MEKTIKFGVIGCGLMGREFASASMRWLHLQTSLQPRFFISAMAASAEPPVASMGSTIRMSRSAISFGILQK